MFGYAKRKREREALATLKRMSETTWTCKTCKESHTGLMDLGLSSPDVWPNEEILKPNSELTFEGDFLSEDFCVVGGETFMIRCVLKFHVEGLGDEFGFGVWLSLSKDNFEIYLQNFDEGFQSCEHEWSSWFCSHIGYFGKTVGEKAWVVPRPNRQRPLVYFMDENSVIGRAHRAGLAASTLVEIFEYYGNHLPE